MDAVTGTIAFVEVDDSPMEHHWYGDSRLSADFDDLPEGLHAALEVIGRNTDDAHCGNPACTHMVGYTLHGDADEQVRWNYTFVMAYGKSTKAFCEDCAAPMTVWMF